MRLRFKPQYSGLDQRIVYETASMQKYEVHGNWCYDLKILGLVPCDVLEECAGDEIEAIDVYIQVTKDRL